LTIDASIGTNAIAQAREFAACSGASAIALTKLDGTGKGGAAVQIQTEFKLPILFVGLGEQPEDLQPFDPKHYAEAVFALPQE
ncbi:MAG TPA: signal recognition particle-docking protein FtsY, partial [Lentisphaeria bacterium]|nr:signal recognition particle-docking protein FtsY [Lentisphaeria bacterium]